MNGGRSKSSSKPPQLLPRYADPYVQRELSPGVAAANQAALAQAAEAAARANSRHHEMITGGIPPTPPNGEEMMVDMSACMQSSQDMRTKRLLIYCQGRRCPCNAGSVENGPKFCGVHWWVVKLRLVSESSIALVR